MVIITKKLTFCFYFDKYYYIRGSIQQRNPGKLVFVELWWNHIQPQYVNAVLQIKAVQPIAFHDHSLKF